MNPISRFVRSMTRAVARHDAGFEAYYHAVAQNTDGGPTAMEARRDYQQARRVTDRIGMF